MTPKPNLTEEGSNIEATMRYVKQTSPTHGPLVRVGISTSSTARSKCSRVFTEVRECHQAVFHHIRISKLAEREKAKPKLGTQGRNMLGDLELLAAAEYLPSFPHRLYSYGASVLQIALSPSCGLCIHGGRNTMQPELFHVRTHLD